MGILVWRAQYCHTIIRQKFSNHQFLPTTSKPLNCLLTNQWRSFEIPSSILLSISQCRVSRYLPSFVDACFFMLLSYCVILLHSAPVSSNEVFRNILRRLDHIFSWVRSHIRARCIQHYRLRVHEAQWNHLHFLSARQWRFLGRFVPRLRWPRRLICQSVHLRLLVFALSDSYQWRQCSPVNWYRIPGSFPMYSDSRQRHFDYLKCSRIRCIGLLYEQALMLQCSPLVGGRDRRVVWQWPKWCITNFLIKIVLPSLLWRVHLLLCVWGHCHHAL